MSSMKYICLCIGIILSESGFGLAYPGYPLAYTRSGILRGKYETSRNGNQYESFIGIRYAIAPRRFDISIPTGSWPGIRDAVIHGPPCAQPTVEGGAAGEEDCLYLNVYTPRADNKRRAVLFYVHGGGFSLGAGSEFGGSFLVDEDIVLVTINYRLGIFGFLDTPSGPVAGNMGLKDQVEALKWVRRNIEFFGGNKYQVTLSGNSAGSASVHHLMISPSAQGLFHGLYGMSGSTLNPWAFRDSNIQDVREFGAILKCHARDDFELIRCLRNAPLDQIINAQDTIKKWDFDFFKIIPSREIRSRQNPAPFLDERPEDRIKSGSFNKVPVLITMAKDEGGTIYATVLVRNEKALKSLNDDYDRVAPITFLLDRDFENIKAEVATEMRKFYFDDQIITPEMENKLIEAYADTYFHRGIQRTAQLLAVQTTVYLGIFTHPRSDYNPADALGVKGDIDGVLHCEDLSYIFNPTGVPGPLPFVSALTEEKDIEFSKKFVHMLASFIKRGFPAVPFGGNPTWAPVSKVEADSNALNWFELNENSSLLMNPYEKRNKFWEELASKAKAVSSKR